MPVYVLTRDDLKQSADSLVRQQAEWVRDEPDAKNPQGGMKVAEYDVSRNRVRGFTINGREFGTVLNQVHSAESAAEISFKEIVNKELGPEVAPQLEQAYSQGLEGFLVNPLVFHSDIGASSGRAYLVEERETNLYRKGNDVYYKVSAEGYTSQRNPEGYFAAPVEILYQLKEYKNADGAPSKFTFELQYVKTSSEFIRDLYQGKEIKPVRLAEEIGLYKRKCSRAIEIANDFKRHSLRETGPMQNIFNIAIETVEMYKKNKIDAVELEIALQNLKPFIKQQEKPASLIASLYPSKSMTIMQNALADVRKLPDYSAIKAHYKKVSRVANEATLESKSPTRSLFRKK